MLMVEKFHTSFLKWKKNLYLNSDLSYYNQLMDCSCRYPKRHLVKELDNESCYDGLEVWSLSDVVFLDDSPAILGRVVTVDHLQAIVDISCASSESGTMGSTSAAQSTLKVFKLNDIEPCMDKCVGVTVTRGGVESCKDKSVAGTAARAGIEPCKDKSVAFTATRSGIEPCKDKCVGVTGAKGAGKGEGSKAVGHDVVPRDGDRGVTISHHIAGVVQHRPSCLLTPDPQSHPPTTTQPHPPRDHHQDNNNNNNHHPPCTCIHGYYPLAVHVTDDGPMMLVKRVSDGSAFLVCSGHPGFPSFSSSSFVSLSSSRDSKPGRATIDEESVSAVDGGFDREAWDTRKGDGGKGLNRGGTKGLNKSDKDGMKEFTEADSGGKTGSTEALNGGVKGLKKADKGGKIGLAKADKGGKKGSDSGGTKGLQKKTDDGGLNAKVEEANGLKSRSAWTLTSHPSFLQLHKSDAILLHDSNGVLCPLLEGLRLSPSPLLSQRGKKTGPVLPYKCVTTRFHTVKKNCTALLVVLGKCGHTSYQKTTSLGSCNYF